LVTCELSGGVIGAEIEVHREIGPGLLEVAQRIALQVGTRKDGR
jgi:hypothetical protein